MAKDPAPHPKQLQEGERVIAYFRRRRLENVLTLVFGVGLLVVLIGRFQNWAWETRVGIYAVLIVLLIPSAAVMSTHYWLTDRRVLRGLFGMYKAYPLENATPRVVKDPLANTVRFEGLDGTVKAQVKFVDNAPKILRLHAEAANPPAAAPAAGDATADAQASG